MDPRGAAEPPARARRPGGHSSGTVASKGHAAPPRSPLKITPFHRPASPHGEAASGRPAAAPPGRLTATPPGSRFLDTLGRLPGPQVRGRPPAAGSSEEAAGPPPGEQGAPLDVKLPARKSSKDLRPGRAASIKPRAAVKRRKRKMGMYNLVPKKKARALKQQDKAGPPSSLHQSLCPQSSTQQPGLLPETPKASPETPKASPETPKASPETPKASPETPKASPEPDGGPEYTELALEQLLSPPPSGAEVAGGALAEELPLCCCRMETPRGGGPGAPLDLSCMAMESTDGTLIGCHRRVKKQEMMRPSNTVHLLVLCEDHRAGMVKHHCCPGCGLFCRAGSFMECRPYGSISHRFHRACASILRDLRFCPHCGEDASGAVEVTAPPAEPPPRAAPPPSLAAARGATPPPGSATPTVPQTLRAKKSSEPRRSREESPSRVKGEALSDRRPPESLESILVALDDENLQPKQVKPPPRQLYLCAERGELQKVVRLLVDGRDPNFLMDGHSRGTPLHAAAAGGHQEVCHMLVQAGANLDMFDEQQRTPLMAACENSHLDTVTYLLRAGAGVGHKDIVGFTCLHLAAKLGHCDIVHHLLSKASKHVNCQDDGGWTPITWAVEYKHTELVQLLLSRGADVNIRDKEENVCLHWAALSGCDDVALALLEARCDLNAINVHGDSALHVAAREDHLDCVMLFLSRGADGSQRNKEGQSSLDCSAPGSAVRTALHANRKLADARRGRARHGERVLSRDISRGYEAVPISCVNGVDGEPAPDGYQYLPDSCVTSPLHVDRDITRLQHCSCADDCSSSSCMCGQLSLQCCYDSEGRLPLDFSLREPPVLFECNHACSCWRTCRNRVVQNGLRTRLQLFRTQKMGWGVRALQDVPQGTFICEYVGEIITDAEADRRENDSFLFTLDNKVGDVHCIDARLYGNVGRFLNHLCEPNLLALRVFTLQQDPRLPRIAFFSSRPIRAGEQMGFDYGDHYWRVKSKFFSCQCGSFKCRQGAGAR